MSTQCGQRLGEFRFKPFDQHEPNSLTTPRSRSSRRARRLLRARLPGGAPLHRLRSLSLRSALLLSNRAKFNPASGPHLLQPFVVPCHQVPSRFSRTCARVKTSIFRYRCGPAGRKRDSEQPTLVRLNWSVDWLGLAKQQNQRSGDRGCGKDHPKP